MEIRGIGAIVTGASRGLGAAVARELARGGARVALVARGREALEEVAGGIRAAGGEAHALPYDVGEKEAIHRIAGVAAALVGPVDLLVNAAGTLGPVPLAPLLDTSCEDLSRALEVNLLGPFRLTKAIAGSMSVRGRGLVVNVTSDAATVAYPLWGAYGASKAALDQLTRIWAAELEPSGVRFLLFDPGEMDTLMHAEAMPDADRSTLAGPEERARALVAVIRESGSGAPVAPLATSGVAS